MLADLLNTVIETVQGMNLWLVAGIAFLGLLLETSLFVGFLVPGDATLLVTATSVTSFERWGLIVIAAVLGALAGESIGYALGRWLGPTLKRSWLGRRIGLENWAQAETLLAQRGGLAVFVSRFLPVLHSLVPVTAGMARMRYRKFMAWTLPACLLWAVAYVSVGAFATSSFQQLSTQLHWAGFIFAAIIAVFVLVMWFVKRWLSKRVAAQLAADTKPDPSTVP
ncbi:DedA family protein [Gulosibacter sp. ACHW.36C]|uniref:DedA family protein n=1 Tax=Gulosibacter sediminis TaxID=1729695 RepID=A0ABY4MWK9_9MICO|nr:DedA family protein [Gulosibacter sediminis]UQN14110.1 DedA family protein [Gulosibacter sediminis]